MRQEELQLYTRRHFFRQSGFGIGPLALYLLQNERASGADMLAKAPHFAPKAKRIVFLFMAGAPSQLDLLDYKPALNRYDGQPVPEDVIKGERFAFIKGTPKLLGSPHQLCPLWTQRRGDFQSAAAPGEHRGRHRDCPIACTPRSSTMLPRRSS